MRGQKYDKVCQICGDKFISNRSDAKNCSEKCSAIAANENHKKYYNGVYYPKNKEEIIKKVMERRSGN